MMLDAQGKGVIRLGDKTACGATLISSIASSD